MKYLILIFCLLYSYAVIRYHIGKELGFDYFFFILNKAIAWSAATCLGLSVLTLKKTYPSKRFFGISSFILSLFHICLTLILAIVGFFPDYYNTNGISNAGLQVLMTGILTILLMAFPLMASLFPNKFPKTWIKLGKFALITNIFHPVIIGFKNWSDPISWPLLLPPITLLTTLIYSIIILIYWKQKKSTI
jgi:hypothetical protein